MPVIPDNRVYHAPTVKNAIATNLQTDGGYVEMALALGYTIKKYNPRLDDLSTELILLVPYDNNLTPASVAKLERIGWTIKNEEDVKINGTEALWAGFQRNFIKFRVWTWTEYRKVLLLDADTICFGDISLLLSDGFGKSPAVSVYFR